MSRSKSPPKKTVVLPEKKLQASQSRVSPIKKADPSDVYSGESINITTPTHKEKKRPRTAKKSSKKELSKEEIELFSSKIAEVLADPSKSNKFLKAKLKDGLSLQDYLKQA